MINPEHEQMSVRRQCVALSISRSTVYYRAEPIANESVLANEIRDLWLDNPSCGYRKITAALQRQGHEINHKKVLRMMRDMRIQALYPKPRTTIHNVQHKKYPYLLRGLEITSPNHVWQTDITYIRLDIGFVYLVGIIDVFSGFLIAWLLSNTLEAEFCLKTLDNALLDGKKPEILNTDQGVQFTSTAWVSQVEENGIKVSMDGIGRWADNIFIERFWRTLKHEHVLLHAFESIKEARKSIGQFIDNYNHKRLHQSLGYKTPAEIYLRQN